MATNTPAPSVSHSPTPDPTGGHTSYAGFVRIHVRLRQGYTAHAKHGTLDY